jgi:hypothetical protein
VRDAAAIAQVHGDAAAIAQRRSEGARAAALCRRAPRRGLTPVLAAGGVGCELAGIIGMGAQSRHPSGPGTLNLDFEETSEPEPEGLSAFAFALIVCLCVAYWYGVAALFFFGTLNDSPVMVILGCILAPIPCITVGALRWRELHNR